MIVIPMAGLSSRFFKAGYNVPKYQLMLDDKTVFAHSLLSFKAYFASELFLIIIRDVYNTHDFVVQQLEQLAIKNYHICVLQDETQGQAHTVYLGLQSLALTQDEPIYIFNIDTFRHEFVKPNLAQTCEGYLEVFRGEGEHWSFIELDENDTVIRTTEKERISDLCSDGLYYFKSARLFQQLFEFSQANRLHIKGELYIAPMYNLMIQQNMQVCYVLIELSQIDFCGTPDEYQALLKKY